MADFHGEAACVLENHFVRLEYLAHSARVVRFAPQGKRSLFADLGKDPTPTPYGDFYFRGGHRLWHAPEAMPRTYIPDNDGATLDEIENGVRIHQPAEVWTHIAKSLTIQLNPDQPQVILRHELRNEGAWTVELAPWALTMLRLGGVGIFPQPVRNAGDTSLLPNRKLAFWPYARLDDPRLILRDDCILVRAHPQLPPLKFGYFNPDGWMGYWLDGILFVKRFDAHMPASQYPDGGCNVESYCNDKFIQLESVRPVGALTPGQTIIHTELWEISDGLDAPFISEEIRRLIDKTARGSQLVEQ